MRQIRKQREPKFWREFRKTPGATYGIEWMPKQELREALAKEQGYLCCYCMGRIEDTQDGMKVEHWRSQSEHGEVQIDYENLLGACNGNQGHPFPEQHCDTHKKNTSISVNPASADRDCSKFFRYLSDGSIRPSESLPEDEKRAISSDLEVLNINVEKLKVQRKALLDGLRSWLDKEHAGRSVSREILLQKAQEWERSGADGKLKPFCQVAIFWLNKAAKGR